MDRSSQIKLISVTITQDTIQQDIATESSKLVFCNIGSISGEEFLRAGQLGLKPSYKVTMFKYDYSEEKIVEIDSKRYQVYRTYEARNDMIELYLEERAGV